MWVLGGGGLARRPVVLLSATGSASWPLATYRCPSLKSFPSIGGGAHPLPLPPWPILTSPLTLPLAWQVAPMEPPDFPCFTALCQLICFSVQSVHNHVMLHSAPQKIWSKKKNTTHCSSRLATSVCQLRHDQMEQGPTEPHAGRSTFLLSSGGAGGGYY